jgi:CRP/FNR family transcriptional regulator
MGGSTLKQTLTVQGNAMPGADSAVTRAQARSAWYGGAPQALKSPDMPIAEEWFSGVVSLRRKVLRKQWLFRTGEPRRGLYLIHAGCFRTSLLSGDGREKVTGFHLRGDLLGLDALDSAVYTCEACALDLGEVWELMLPERARIPEFQHWITSAQAREIRRNWQWMLMLSSYDAEQRVVAFLLDMTTRLAALGFSARYLLLRMTRSDLGNYLALQLETVTRVLSHLDALGLIAVSRSEIRIDDYAALQAMLSLSRRSR